jgi:hypothetical protein
MDSPNKELYCMDSPSKELISMDSPSKELFCSQKWDCIRELPIFIQLKDKPTEVSSEKVNGRLLKQT